MRIYYQSMTPLHALPGYVNSLAAHVKAVCPADTEVQFHGIDEAYFEGSSPTEVYRYPYLKHRILGGVVERGREAQAQGFDCFVLGSFSEPYLTELRSVLDIPVISMAESAALLACSFAPKFAFVSLSTISARRLSAIIEGHGLVSRVSGFHALSTPVNEPQLEAAFADPAQVVTLFRQTALEAVAQGADAVIPAEGVISEVLHGAGVRQIDGATVVDSIGATLLYANMLVQAQRHSGMGVGRRWGYLRPTPAMLSRVGVAKPFIASQ